MNWYLVKIVFRICPIKDAVRPQFDEQLRIVSADSKEEALLKARIIAIGEEDFCLRQENNQVTWEFINIPEITEVSTPGDGQQLTSRTIETEAPEDFIREVHERALFLRNECYY